MVKKDEVIKYLRHVGDDVAPEDESLDTSPECEGVETCPKHKNCGICRFEYMRKKGWLNPELSRQKKGVLMKEKEK